MFKLTIKIPERRHWRRSAIFIVSSEHISHLALVFLLLTLNMRLSARNFQKKRKKNQVKKSDSKQRQGTKCHHCDICKLLINEVYLNCNLCNKIYHSVCVHFFSSVIEQIAGQAYDCFNCINDKNFSFYYFLARKAIHAIEIRDNFIKEQHEVWKSIRYLTFPLQSHYQVLPKKEKMLVASKRR